jgi:hypothetical protein
MVTIDHKKQAGLTIQTPVTDLEAILARYIHHYTAVSNVFKKKQDSMILCQQVTCFR